MNPKYSTPPKCPDGCCQYDKSFTKASNPPQYQCKICYHHEFVHVVDAMEIVVKSPVPIQYRLISRAGVVSLQGLFEHKGGATSKAEWEDIPTFVEE